MITGDYFAGTLFGKKPLTFQEFHDNPWNLSSYAMVNPYYYFYLDDSWQTWLKYRELFPSKHFIFTKISSQKGGYEFLILINKTAFRDMFNANHDLFEQALGPNVTVEKIFRDFDDQQKGFFQILNNHEGLVGLVLGYGREGSMQVHYDWALKLQILRNTLYPLSPPMEEHKLPRNILTSVKFQEKKLAQRRTKWHQIFHTDMAPVEDPYVELSQKNQRCEFLLPPWQERVFHILPPNFTVVKGSAEAKELKKEYDGAIQLAKETFKTKSFLRGFLEQYCQQE